MKSSQNFKKFTDSSAEKSVQYYQPRVPADLGFYDLRVPETRMAQVEMARDYGIEAFCYYWGQETS